MRVRTSVSVLDKGRASSVARCRGGSDPRQQDGPAKATLPGCWLPSNQGNAVHAGRVTLVAGARVTL
jgi:hypothetical protein